MDESRRSLAKLLRRLADDLLSLPDADYRDLLDGRLHLAFSRKGTSQPRKKCRDAIMADKHALADIAAELQQLSDREAGLSLVRRRCRTKTCLEQIARFLDLPVRREDTTEALQEKIIEATIGFRLRSQAIRGKTSDTPSGQQAP